MNKSSIPLNIPTALVIILFVAMLNASTAFAQAETVHGSATTVAESTDFANQILRDPWDMSEYSDVSMYINESAQRIHIQNMSISNGIFAGTSAGNDTDGLNAYFFPLFGGYHETMPLGKIGLNYPIASNQFGCFYAAMKVDSGAATQRGPDIWRVLWYETNSLDTSRTPWGIGIERLYPEAGNGQPTAIWKLHKMDLRAPWLTEPAANRWDDKPLWRAIRFEPTIQGGAAFQIDWLRLTDCTANTTTISWTPNRTITAIWLQPAGATHQIRLAAGIDGAAGSYALDVQGVTPGQYTVGLGTDTTCCVEESSEPLIINAAPRVQFVRPSFTSGEDYASTNGNTWDFGDAADAASIANVPGVIEEGVLKMTTPSSKGLTDYNPQIYLNMPTTLDTKKYRYLSIRMYTEWDVPWQDIISGMIGRWGWIMPSYSGNANEVCNLMSQDIGLDVGWHIYTIDLHDYFNGGAEIASPPGSSHCPRIAYSPQEPPTNVASNQTHWFNAKPLTGLRLDPNENISCGYREATGNTNVPCSDYRQQIDWITLTAMDAVTAGELYEIQLALNKQMSAADFTFYYTTDVGQPKQARAIAYQPSSPSQPPSGDVRFYLPTAFRAPVGQATGLIDVEFPVSFQWDTSGVAAGLYHICAEGNDGVNTTIYCSEANIQVTE